MSKIITTNDELGRLVRILRISNHDTVSLTKRQLWGLINRIEVAESKTREVIERNVEPYL